MDFEEYKKAVIGLFKSGRATDAEWSELGQIICDATGTEIETEKINLAVMGPRSECSDCGSLNHAKVSECWGCEKPWPQAPTDKGV